MMRYYLLICILFTLIHFTTSTTTTTTNSTQNVNPQDNETPIPIVYDPNSDKFSPPSNNKQSQAHAADNDPHSSLLTSSIMVIVSEIGDKTFLVAAILAMTHPRLIIFTGAFSALAVMSVLSAILGTIVPTLISRSLTQALAGILFFIFGIKMIQEARVMNPNECEEEMIKVQAEIHHHHQDEDDLEMGHISYTQQRRRRQKPALRANNTSSLFIFNLKHLFTKMKNTVAIVFRYTLTPIFVETFVLTFLAEWGDRSQIATIAMAATGDVMSVIFGTILGHSLCTGLAVLGGKLLAAKISIRSMTYIGGFVFLIFGILTFVPFKLGQQRIT